MPKTLLSIYPRNVIREFRKLYWLPRGVKTIQNITQAATIASSLSSQNITPEPPEQWKENRLNSNCSDEEIKLVVSRLEESDKIILVS